MSRQARIVVAQELFHVTQRGNYRQKIFEDNIDRAYYLKLLEEHKNKYGLELYAYCLMDNHVHLIVRPLHLSSLSNTICRCHQKYSYYLHKKKGIQGHLWQERFYSCLLYGEHIRQALRYVERNPVRAGIVKDAWDYHWSSAKAHLGLTYKVITLSDISKYSEGLNWKEFISYKENEGELKKIRDNTLKSSVLGPEDTVKLLELKLNRRILPLQPGRPKKV